MCAVSHFTSLVSVSCFVWLLASLSALAQLGPLQSTVVTRWLSEDGQPRILAEPLDPTAPYQAALVSSVAAEAKAGDSGRICLVIDGSLRAALSSFLNPWQVQLGAEGYSSVVLETSGGTVEDLKVSLRALYDSPESLTGAVLVGDQPFAVFEMFNKFSNASGYDSFACDLFLMDLNGVWSDSRTEGSIQPGNGKYDTWTGNQFAEIWVSRLPVHKMPLLGDAAPLGKAYFTRNLVYRQQNKSTVEALSYIAPDWTLDEPSDRKALEGIYGAGNVVSYADPPVPSTATYLEELTNHYQTVKIRSHGSPGGHAFDSWVSASEYLDGTPGARFYSFFVCSGNDYTYDNYLGAMPVLDPSGHGLASWGSTKTGGMLGDYLFYESMEAGNSIGEAFQEWINAALNSSNYSPDWYYGMVIAGDGSLRPDTQSNDDFEDRISLRFDSGSVAGRNARATLQVPEALHGAVPAGKSVWFVYFSHKNGRLELTTEGSKFDTTLAVYTGTAMNSLSLVKQNNDAGSEPWSRVLVDVTEGSLYQIALAGKNNGDGPESGGYRLNWKQLTAPVNDDFTQPQPISGQRGQSKSNTFAAGVQSSEPAHGPEGAYASVWWSYQYTGTGSAAVTVDTQGSDYDTVLAVYTGNSLNALTLVASNDDYATDETSRVGFTATPGVTYRIAVDSAEPGTSGNVVLNWTETPLGSSDSFAARTRIGGISGRSAGNNSTATAEAGEPNHGGVSHGKSVWWEFEPPNAELGGIGKKVTFSTAGSTFDTVLAVYKGNNVGGLTLVTSNNDADGTLQSRVSFTLANTNYQVVVDSGTASKSGDIALAWNINDTFADRLVLPPQSSGLQSGGNAGASRETGEPPSRLPNAARSVWFSWTPPSDVTAEFSVQGYSSPEIAVFTGGAINALSEVSYVNQTGALAQFCAKAGTPYAISVEGVSGGNFELQWTTVPVGVNTLDIALWAGEGGFRVNNGPVLTEYSGDFSACDIVTVTAVDNNPSWSFLRWTGRVNTSTRTVEIPMTTDADLNLAFYVSDYQLVAACAGPGDLRVNSEDVGSYYSEYIEKGESVTLEAIPAPGYTFAYWESSEPLEGNPVEVVMNTTRYIYAHFVKKHEVRIPVEKDATIYEEYSSPQANGAGQWLFAGYDNGASRRALMRFNVASQIPEGALIENATIELHLDPVAANGDTALRLFRLATNWGEGTVDPSGDEFSGTSPEAGSATWLHTFYDESFWGTEGGDVAGQGDAFGLVGDAAGLYTLPAPDEDALASMRGDVQLWVDSPALNFGWILLGAAPDDLVKRFASREHPDPTQHPVLRVVYSEVYTGAEPDCESFNGQGLPAIIGAGDNDDILIQVPESFTIADLNVSLSANIDYVDGIVMKLNSPQGTEVLLTQNVPVLGSDFIGTVFNDESITSINFADPPFTGEFRPASALLAVDGEEANGNWFLEIENQTGDPLTVQALSLCFVRVAAGEGEGEGEGVLEGEGAVEGEGAIDGEGTVDGEGSSEGEGAIDGEGSIEGEGALDGEGDGVQSADTDGNFIIDLGELIRVIQLYNAEELHCAEPTGSTEDGFAPGAGDRFCEPHDSDYLVQDWIIDLSELLRLIQLYYLESYTYCPGLSEDNFCSGS